MDTLDNSRMTQDLSVGRRRPDGAWWPRTHAECSSTCPPRSGTIGTIPASRAGNSG